MRRIRAALVTVAICSAVALVGSTARAAEPSVHYAGVLTDGASWVADVPQNFNGTIILYSHGFGPLVAADSPSSETGSDLLAQGYALVGSSYSGTSGWAMASAANDQFASLAALEHIIGAPKRVIAWGTSMGGLVSAEEAQNSRGQLAGVLTTCGLVAGALNLNNYQLDGEYALSHLLAPQENIQLVRYAEPTSANVAANQLSTVASNAQNTAAGRARVALAAALLNEPTWATGGTPPARTDYDAQEAQQASLLSGLFGFIVPGRYQIEQAAGGNSSFTRGVDYTTIMSESSYLPEVRALYQEAGLDLDADLATLTHDANIDADPPAIATLGRTSMVTGQLSVPELDIHTVADQLVPVQQENWYGQQVHQADDTAAFRQAYVQATGHCNFTPAETITAMHALEHRLDTGRWADVATPDSLNAAVNASGLGSAAPYVQFQPPVLANARS
jgi:hypothetical protein